MYDKTVRRRRVVLGLLVASSLILLTAYFGESAGGGLHSVQRGVLDVVSPIQEGASKALKPVRDLFGWAGDTFHAKGQLKDMRKDRDALRAQNIQLQAKLHEQAQLGDQIALNNQHGLADNRPVSARVIGQDPNLWFTQVTIDQGTSAGVNVNQAVVNGAGLVGKVTWVSPGTSIVTLVTDHTTQIGATVSREPGQGDRAGRGGPPDRPRARLAVGQGRRPARGDRRHLRHRVEGRQVPLPVSPRHPDRPRHARRRRRAATTSRSTSRRSPTGGASTSSRC